MNNMWTDKTNYYSLPRPYKQNRPSFIAPTDSHRQQVTIMQRPTDLPHGRIAVPVPPKKATVIKADYFVPQGIQDSPLSEHSATTWLSPENEHGYTHHSPNVVWKARRDKYSFYNDLLEYEKERALSNEPHYMRIDDHKGPGRYVACVGGDHFRFQNGKPIKANQEKKKTYVKDIAGAHLPIYQRIGAFHGYNRPETEIRRHSPEKLSNHFSRRAPRPASVLADNWVISTSENTDEYIIPVGVSSHAMNGRWVPSGRTPSETNLENGDGSGRGRQRGRNQGNGHQHRRSHSAVRPQSVYYF